MARESDLRIDRRTFLAGSAAWLLCPHPSLAAHHEQPGALPTETLKLLESSPFVYVSPLRSDGTESRCHGEVWYGWIDGVVLLNAESGTWKARAVSTGLTGARVWVGDHGRWKGLIGPNEAFRKAPHFDAVVDRVTESALNEKLLAAYDTKYAESFDRWRDKMRQGFENGDRVVLRYTPA